MLRSTAPLGVWMLLPGTAWSFVALGLASALPLPSTVDPPAPEILWQGRRGTSIVSDGPNPCTGKPATLDASVETKVTVVGAAPAPPWVDVDVAFDTTPGRAADRLIPIVERFRFALEADIADGERSHIHRLKVPVVDRLSGSYLSVTLAAVADAHGLVTVVPAQAQLVCFAAEDEGARG